MSNPNWNKKVAVIPPTEAELEAIRYRGAPLSRPAPRQKDETDATKTLTGAARNAVVAAGLSRRQE
jgi:hypothetical protein